MGTWSIGVYNNDTALDFMWKVVYKSFEMAEINDEYLVVADMFIKYGAVDHVGEIIEKLTQVINEELSDDYINNYKEDEREFRKKTLNDMLKEIEKLKSDLKKELKEEKKCLI